jgi:signal transduction histidine kinase
MGFKIQTKKKLKHRNKKPGYYTKIDKTKQSASKKIFEEAKEKQEIIPQLTKIAIKAISIGIILTIFIETYYIFYIHDITTFDIIINISLTIVVFFIATAYLLHELEKTSKNVKDAHEIIETLINNLEMKIKDRTSEVDHLLNQKNEFINCLSHDLKTPLNPIVNTLPLLEKKITDPQSLEIIDVLKRNVEYMRNLIEKTLELAYLSTPHTKFSIEEINLQNLLNNVIKNNKLLLDENRIILKNKISDNILVKADKLRLTELFNNLINNAVKYTNESGTITINTIKENNYITISINDTGIGMSEEQQNQVFDEFYKADGSRHDFYSNGLGMTICKRIIEKQGGKIWVESEGLGKGSTFYFSIPISLPQIDNKITDININISNKVDMILDKKII